jgi:hypothetical protein
MVHQFLHQLSEPRYWVDEEKGRQAILGRRHQDPTQKMDYEEYRFGFRAIARSTDTRTAIVGPIPKNVFCGNSLLVSRRLSPVHDSLSPSIGLAVQALLNSMVLDFSLRQSVSANINMFFIYQLPVPRLTEADASFNPIVDRAARLICTSPEFDDLARDVGLGSHKNGVTDLAERARLRAELDGLVGHVYGLTEAEFSHILGTFPLVPEIVKVAAHNAFRDVERGLIQ